MTATGPGLRGQSGMSLVEVMVTLLVLLTGTLATLSVMSSSGRLSAEADRYGVAVSVAQREIEKLRPIDYDRLALNGAAPSSFTGALVGAAAAEQPVTGGVVAPGPDPFVVQGVTGRIYRFVTWRGQSCPLLTGKVAASVSSSLGQPRSEVEAAIGADLCPGTQQTKRLTVVITLDSPDGLGPHAPYRLATVVTDPDSTVLSSGNYDGLRVDASQVTETAAGTPAQPTTTYANVRSQPFYLYDTRCDAAARQPITVGHETRSTALQGSTCGGSGRPDLMGLEAIPGDGSALLYDYSTDVTRPAAGGLALLRDSLTGSCTENLRYSSAESGRRRSLHMWATPAAATAAATADSGGRATLTFFTRTATGQPAAGRLCVALMRESTGQVVASSDYTMPAWPSEVTQLAVSMELPHLALAAGERLLLAVRVPSDSGADIQMLYDHPAYPSNLSLAMREGGTFS